MSSLGYTVGSLLLLEGSLKQHLYALAAAVWGPQAALCTPYCSAGYKTLLLPLSLTCRCLRGPGQLPLRGPVTTDEGVAAGLALWQQAALQQQTMRGIPLLPWDLNLVN